MHLYVIEDGRTIKLLLQIGEKIGNLVGRVNGIGIIDGIAGAIGAGKGNDIPDRRPVAVDVENLTPG